MQVEVMKSNIFDKEGHESCCEEHSHRIFNCKVELQLSCGVVKLETANFVKNKAHDEFIEKDHQY